ncbi:MAG: WYL domain-containing protein [Bacteroidaceae bacterium]|nr:WYL domain-containing protein [Bacteroidaceae bacterium]
MNNAHSLSQFKFDIWLIEQLKTSRRPGLTLEELRRRWLEVPNRKGNLSRDMLTLHRQSIRDFLGLHIEAPDRMHYRIMNPEALALSSLANDLLKSIQNYAFLQEYKALGSLIQPEQIETGSRYLQQIGRALTEKRKLSVTYQKFADEAPYTAVLHPYCLKADKGRWYILAHKEGSKHPEPVQVFALDRTSRLEVMADTFVPDSEVDVEAYFRDCFGVWHDFETYPVRDITITCTERVAHYLRTLPLHHSQKEDSFREGRDARVVFHYRISPSPDFLAELSKWGDGVKVKGYITKKAPPEERP